MIKTEEKQRFQRAIERELVAGQRREPLWSDLLQEHDGNEKAAKRAYINARTQQLVDGELERRQQRRRKRKKRSYHDRNALSAMFGRRVIYMVMVATSIVVAFLMLLLTHDEGSRWLHFFSNEGPQLQDQWDPTR